MFMYFQQTTELHSFGSGFSITFLIPPKGKIPCSPCKSWKVAVSSDKSLHVPSRLLWLWVPRLFNILVPEVFFFISVTFPLSVSWNCRRRSWRFQDSTAPPSWKVSMSGPLPPAAGLSLRNERWSPRAAPRYHLFGSALTPGTSAATRSRAPGEESGTRLSDLRCREGLRKLLETYSATRPGGGQNLFGRGAHAILASPFTIR